MKKKVKLVIAEWSSFCNPVKEYLQELSTELDMELEVVDFDEHRLSAYSWGVKGVPTTLLFNHNNRVSQSLIGVKTKEELKEFIKG